MLTKKQLKHYATAITYVARRSSKKGEEAAKTWPLNRGDLMLLVALIEQELQAGPPLADPLRLEAMREKLGDLVADAPQMSKEEARKFKPAEPPPSPPPDPALGLN
jgi:hypothetical protein